MQTYLNLLVRVGLKEPINDIKVTINEFERFVNEAINVKVGF